MNIIHCTFLQAKCIMMSGVLIVVQFPFVHFWQSQKVSTLVTILLCTDNSYLLPADREFSQSAAFRNFRRQLFHSSLSTILQSLKPGMTKPEVTLCSDGHYRRAIYGLGPYIADYPEQVLLAGIVQGWCPK